MSIIPISDQSQGQKHVSILRHISGPVAWYQFKWNNRTFIVFGDQHRSLAHNCAHEGLACSHFDAYLQPHEDDPECYEITYLLAKLFDRAVTDHQEVDFFAEVTLGADSTSTLPSESQERFQSVFPTMPTLNIHEMVSYRKTLQFPDPQLEEDYANLDYLHLIEYTFEDCFFPVGADSTSTFPVADSNCPYAPYVRFHPTDIRWLINGESVTIPAYTTYYVQYIVSDVPSGYDVVVEIANIFFEELTIIAEELFDAYLLSDDFVTTIDNLFAPMKERLQQFAETDADATKYVQEIFSVIENVKRHAVGNHSIVKAKLDELRQDNIMVNDHNMADLIIMYFQGRFHEINIAGMSQLWRYYYDEIYTPTIRGEKVNPDVAVFFYQQAEVLLALFQIDILLMDAYVLASMFHQRSDISITYTGIEHTLDYVGFFEYIGISPVDSIHSKEEETNFAFGRCIENVAFGEIFGV